MIETSKTNSPLRYSKNEHHYGHTRKFLAAKRDKESARLGYTELGCARPHQLLGKTEESIFGRSTSLLRNSACPLAAVLSCLTLQVLELHGLHLHSPCPCVSARWHMWVLERGINLL